MAPTTLGRYTLDRKLATGGMAEIWVAHQQGPAGFQKEVVLKKILPHLAEDPKFVEMFLDEARLAARLSHPNIVQIFDLGETDGDFFIAMEFVDGRDIQTVVDRCVDIGRPCSAAVAARIVADACTALDYAHNFTDRDGRHVQLVHRDVSPQNILVSNDGIVKLVDFGVAKAATSTHKTQTGAVKGKLSYMSPEQISGEQVDARSDIFALGIVLYELVTGRRPFGHDSELLAITAILNENPPRPCEVIGDLPLEIEAVILKALEKSPDARYQTASEMQLALEHVLRTLGAILTSRDVKLYLEDLFSDAPTGTIPALASVRARPAGAVTQAQHPSATTRPAFSTHEPETVTPADADLTPAPSPRAAYETTADGPTTRRGPAAAARGRTAVMATLIVVIGLLLAGAVGLFVAFGPGTNDTRVGAGTAGDAEPDGTVAESDSGVAAAAAVVDGSAEAVGTAAQGVAAPESGTPDSAEVLDAPAGEPPGVGSGEAAQSGTPGLPDEGSADTKADASTDSTVAATEETVPHEPPDTGAGPSTAEEDAGVGRADDEPASERRRAEPQTGTVRLTFRTGGSYEIRIDGRRVGSYPGTTRFAVDAGPHTVRVIRSDGTEREFDVDVEGGRMENIVVR